MLFRSGVLHTSRSVGRGWHGVSHIHSGSRQSSSRLLRGGGDRRGWDLRALPAYNNPSDHASHGHKLCRSVHCRVSGDGFHIPSHVRWTRRRYERSFSRDLEGSLQQSPLFHCHDDGMVPWRGSHRILLSPDTLSPPRRIPQRRHQLTADAVANTWSALDVGDGLKYDVWSRRVFKPQRTQSSQRLKTRNPKPRN